MRLRDGTRARAGDGRQIVVARIGPAQGQAAGIDNLAAAGVLVDEVGRGRADAQAVAIDHAGKRGAGIADGGRIRGVIYLAASDDVTDLTDIGFADTGRHGGIGQRVVGCQAAAAAIVQGGVDGDYLVIAGVLVGKRGRRACRQRFAANQAGDAALVDGGRLAAIVLFVIHRQVGPGQRLGRDGAGNVGRRGHRIVAGQAGAVKQRTDRHRHRLAGASVLVGIRTGRGTQAQRFAADQASQGAAGQGGGGAAVILPGDGGQVRQGQRFRRDVSGDTSQRPQRIIGAGAAAQATAGADGNVIAGILAGVGANQGGGVENDVGLVGGEHAADAATSKHGDGGAVIDFAAGTDASQAELARRDDQAAVDIRDRIA